MKIKNKIPILMYHEIVHLNDAGKLLNIVQDRYILTNDVFEDHLRLLTNSNYECLTVSEFRNLKDSKDKNIVCITFDDGYEGNYLYAFPLLKRYKCKATFFIVSSWMGKKNMMNWVQINEMIMAGMEVGSHTKNHLQLSLLDESIVYDELLGSKKEIEKNISHVVKAISFPEGSYCRRIEELTKEAGYCAAFCSDFGYGQYNDSNFVVKRIVSSKETTEMKMILEPSFCFLMLEIIKGLVKKCVKIMLGQRLYSYLYFKLFNLQTPFKG